MEKNCFTICIGQKEFKFRSIVNKATKKKILVAEKSLQSVLFKNEKPVNEFAAKISTRFSGYVEYEQLDLPTEDLQKLVFKKK